MKYTLYEKFKLLRASVEFTVPFRSSLKAWDILWTFCRFSNGGLRAPRSCTQSMLNMAAWAPARKAYIFRTVRNFRTSFARAFALLAAFSGRSCRHVMRGLSTLPLGPLSGNRDLWKKLHLGKVPIILPVLLNTGILCISFTQTATKILTLSANSFADNLDNACTCTNRNKKKMRDNLLRVVESGNRKTFSRD